MHVVDEYPGEAAAHCDYITRAPRGEITEEWPDGKRIRPEKVIVTDVVIEMEGRLCFGERTARHLAHEFGMVDGWRVRQYLADHQAVCDERDLLSRELADARRQVDNLLEMEREPVTAVYVDLDGGEHASKGAAVHASRRARKTAPKENDVLVAVEAPEVTA